MSLTSSEGSSNGYLKKQSGNNFKAGNKMRGHMESLHFHPHGVVKLDGKAEDTYIFAADTYLKT